MPFVTHAPPASTPLSASPIDHYENFPVASWLCPPYLRQPITAIYHFARTADDIADEGDATPEERLAQLGAFRAALRVDAHASLDGKVPLSVSPARFAGSSLTCAKHSADQALSPLALHWPHIFGPLHAAIKAHSLPVQLLEDLLDAFVQDVNKTSRAEGYANDAELLDYCRRSANPVGRLLLHLYGVQDSVALERSDAICTALQLINFWQDLGRDIPRGRFYLPADACSRYGLTRADLVSLSSTENTIKIIATHADSARTLMQFGSNLVHQLPGRAGWELRLVVQGGLRILDKIEALKFKTLEQRPALRWWDYGLMVWRAIWM